MSQSEPNAPWIGILGEREGLLWAGRPERGFQWGFRDWFEPYFWCFFIGFSLFWMAIAGSFGGIFWMFGLIFFFAGFWNLLMRPFWDTFMRLRTKYALTDKAAYFWKNRVFFGETVQTFALTKDTGIELTKGDPPSIYFSPTKKKYKSSGKRRRGFERLADGQKVYDLLQSLQLEETT